MERRESRRADSGDEESFQDFLPLFGHASTGDLKSIRNALCVYEINNGRVFDIKIVNRCGMYLIHTASYYGQREIIEFLLSSRSEAEEKNTLLYESVLDDNMSYESNDTEMTLTTSTQDGAQYSDSSYVRSGNAKSEESHINIKSLYQGATPLHFAALGGNRNNIVPYLLVCGADPEIKDVKGHTPQELAKIHGHRRTERTIRKCVEDINKKIEEQTKVQKP